MVWLFIKNITKVIEIADNIMVKITRFVLVEGIKEKMVMIATIR